LIVAISFGWTVILLLHPRRVDRRLTPPIHARRLGLRDPLKLPLAPQVGFELGEYAEHVEEALAGGRAGVDWLFRRRAAGAYRANDILQVADAARQPVDARDHQPFRH
jgi:hypothetical protein